MVRRAGSAARRHPHPVALAARRRDPRSGVTRRRRHHRLHQRDSVLDGRDQDFVTGRLGGPKERNERIEVTVRRAARREYRIVSRPPGGGMPTRNALACSEPILQRNRRPSVSPRDTSPRISACAG
jgi:hypothetical protein